MAAGQRGLSSSGLHSKRSRSSFLDPAEDDSASDGEPADDSVLHNHVERKRRLTVKQVRSLEISFEIENKLEPERKLQLATELGLQPRQVAIWFQNRRARSKTKQLEKDYNHLKEAYESLSSEKEKLQNEIDLLNMKLRSSSTEAENHVIKRERTEYEDCADNACFRDLIWRPVDACVLSLSGNVKLKQPGESDQERQTSISIDAASSSSNGGSTTRNNYHRHDGHVEPHQTLKSLRSPPCAYVHLDAFNYDPINEVCGLQSDRKSGVPSLGAEPHLLTGKDQRLGSHVSSCTQLSYRQQHNVIAFKMEDHHNSFQEECFSSLPSPSDEHYGGLWASWD